MGIDTKEFIMSDEEVAEHLKRAIDTTDKLVKRMQIYERDKMSMDVFDNDIQAVEFLLNLCKKIHAEVVL